METHGRKGIKGIIIAAAVAGLVVIVTAMFVIVRYTPTKEKMSGYNDSKSRKDKHYYISEGMVIAYGIVADYLDDLEVLE